MMLLKKHGSWGAAGGGGGGGGGMGGGGGGQGYKIYTKILEKWTWLKLQQ